MALHAIIAPHVEHSADIMFSAPSSNVKYGTNVYVVIKFATCSHITAFTCTLQPFTWGYYIGLTVLGHTVHTSVKSTNEGTQSPGSLPGDLDRNTGKA